MQISYVLSLVIVCCFPSTAESARLVRSAYQQAATAKALREHKHAYDNFRIKHSREYTGLELHHRLSIFSKRLQAVEALNAQPAPRWVAVINQFSDYTEEEFRRLLGHSRTERKRSTSLSLLQLDATMLEGQKLAQTVDWRPRLNSSAFVKDQGECGSCWAMASVGALEMHAELTMKRHPRQLAVQQLVDCVENPNQCGGQGGCSGATAELAFDYVHRHGISDAGEYSVDFSKPERCRPLNHKPYLQAAGFVHLPPNKLTALMHAVATKGPVVVSVDATDWGPYGTGVFDGCQKDAVVNHAVVLIGYGHDSKLQEDYWILRNSWGTTWGEQGLIRLLRHSSDEGDQGYCGVDSNPLEGVWCKGTATKVPVCGMCGILVDSSYPLGVTFNEL